eukprot:5023145-Alexandrium_andersonii.AAC.1
MKRLGQDSKSSVSPVQDGGQAFPSTWKSVARAVVPKDVSQRAAGPARLKDIDPEDHVVGVALRCHVEVCRPLRNRQ